ncbi:MAG TPA: hypothetical protein VGX00_04965 [Thermoplasmata archaeon]|nr:hypothetical protein [Thermoplasmata archaeon]
MFRQHSLVEMLSARMLETADALDHDLPVTPERVRRALRIHRGFLIEFHIPSDAWVAGELRAVRSSRVERVVRECASEPKRAAEFQASAGALIESSLSPGSLAAHTLATIFRTEAGRIERHHAEEGEVVEPGLGGWVPPSRRRGLLSQIRRLYRTHVKDELALVAWASQIHPSSD